MVLIVVMWMVMFLSVIGGSLLLMTTAERGAHSIQLDLERGEYLARAAVAELGIQALEYYSLPPDQRPPEFTDELVKQDQLGREMPLGAGTVRLSLEDEWGKINVNVAKESILQALCAAVGCPNAGGIAQAVVAWRAQTRPFLRIEELRMIPEVTAEILDLLRPHLTVFTDSATVNPNSATLSVLSAICEDLRVEFETAPNPSGGERQPPPDAGAIISGRPWTAKKLQEDLKHWSSPFMMVTSRVFQVKATGTVRGRSCTVVMVGDLLRMTSGEMPAAAWRLTAVGRPKEPGS